MKNHIKCLRCESEMRHMGVEKLQLGQTGWIFGDISNLLAGAIEVEIYCCPMCKKIEFFLANAEEKELPQKKCPKCGRSHDFDYPKCPYCQYDYYI